MITCAKSLTFNPAATAKLPFAYYKLDTKFAIGGFDGAYDSMPGAYHTNSSNATATNVAGIINDGWNWTGTTVRMGGADFDFTGVSFLIRFWARVIGTPASWAFNIWNILSDSGGNCYKLQVYPFAFGSTFTIRFYTASGGDNFASTYELSAVWQPVWAWYNLGLNTINLKIGTNPTESYALSGPPPSTGPGASRFDLGGVAGNRAEIDELGFWRGTEAEWTASDFTYDYNSGAGRSYP
jgi:hypothetical protein